MSERPPESEVAELLRALARKLEGALGDVEIAVDELGDAFIAMADLADQGFSEHGDRVVRALQFHDRLEQRVRHVCRSLQEISRLTSHGGTEAAWRLLAATIRDSCVVERDKGVFAMSASPKNGAEVSSAELPPSLVHSPDEASSTEPTPQDNHDSEEAGNVELF